MSGSVLRCGGRCERVYGVSVGKCVGVWGEMRGDVRRGMGGVGKSKERCEGCEEVSILTLRYF